MSNDVAGEARRRLVELGGRTADDLGLGRIVGQILVYLYLRESERSLDEIGDDLGLSKAAVSVAVRQLESLGLVRRVWRKGDRRKYYRTADDIASALQQGLLAVVRQKLQVVSAELARVQDMLDEAGSVTADEQDVAFLAGRVKRTRELQRRAEKVLNSPLLKIFVG